jgi:mannosyl-3-phosphoglycerate phosphatase
MNLVIFTDLDGTLIDHRTYDCARSKPAVERARCRGVPVCICSSKTRREILLYREELNIDDPFISENGGAVYIPRADEPGGFEILELGLPYESLVRALHDSAQEASVRIRGFSEMSAEELSSSAGLTLAQARLALQREYDEAFTVAGTPDDVDRLSQSLERRGLLLVRGGRFFHVTGGNDKGRAVGLLMDYFSKRRPSTVSAALGDSPNDIPMLLKVDIPILVRTASGEYDDLVRRAVPRVRLADGIGPEGWRQAVDALLDSHT